MSLSPPLSFSFFSLLLLLSSSISQALVPSSDQFKYVNEGEFGDYVVEYDANYRVLSPFAQPFQLCFYNTTPNAFTLAIRMGTVRSERLMRWVWEANRGNPVRENATFSLGQDGNLVLADANGRVAWQSATANKGVVGFKLLSNGNMVLYDAKGKFIWKSFDSPTDTLLVGQSLRVGAVSKLVSRASTLQNSHGDYSFVVEPKGIFMYYKTKNIPKAILYYEFILLTDRSIVSVKFISDTYTNDGRVYQLSLDYNVSNPSLGGGSVYLATPKFNSTLTYLRLTIDGNLKLFTYYDTEDYIDWDETYTLFYRDGRESECLLPERCGKLGLCLDNQCVGCPLASGTTSWSDSCAPKKVSSCDPKNFYYYRLAGVDHFTTRYTKGDGPIKETACELKCTKDCNCLGYFYHKDTSLCWITYELKTISKVDNSSYVGYIKAPKK